MGGVVVDLGICQEVDKFVDGTVGTRDCIDFASAAVSNCSSARVSNNENGESACRLEPGPGRENLGGGGNGCGKGVADKEDGDFAEITFAKLLKFSSSSASSWALGAISPKKSISSEDKASDRDELLEAVDERENRPKKRDTADGADCFVGSRSVFGEETEDWLVGLASDVNVPVLVDERVDGWLMFDRRSGSGLKVPSRLDFGDFKLSMILAGRDEDGLSF